MQKEKITYMEGLNDLEYLVNEKVIDIWEASAIFGFMFGLPKEMALDELIEVRKRRFDIKPKK